MFMMLHRPRLKGE